MTNQYIDWLDKQAEEKRYGVNDMAKDTLKGGAIGAAVGAAPGIGTIATYANQERKARKAYDAARAEHVAKGNAVGGVSGFLNTDVAHKLEGKRIAASAKKKLAIGLTGGLAAIGTSAGLITGAAFSAGKRSASKGQEKAASINTTETNDMSNKYIEWLDKQAALSLREQKDVDSGYDNVGTQSALGTFVGGLAGGAIGGIAHRSVIGTGIGSVAGAVGMGIHAHNKNKRLDDMADSDDAEKRKAVREAVLRDGKKSLWQGAGATALSLHTGPVAIPLGVASAYSSHQYNKHRDAILKKTQ